MIVVDRPACWGIVAGMNFLVFLIRGLCQKEEQGRTSKRACADRFSGTGLLDGDGAADDEAAAG